MTQDEHELKASIDHLRQIEERHLRTHAWWYALFHGVLVGIGGTLGVGVVLTVAVAGLQRAEVLPVVGDWLAALTPFVQSALQR